jgi:hypothetical protein
MRQRNSNFVGVNWDNPRVFNGILVSKSWKISCERVNCTILGVYSLFTVVKIFHCVKFSLNHLFVVDQFFWSNECLKMIECQLVFNILCVSDVFFSRWSIKIRVIENFFQGKSLSLL